MAHDGCGAHRGGKAQGQGQRSIQQPSHQDHRGHQEQGKQPAMGAWSVPTAPTAMATFDVLRVKSPGKKTYEASNLEANRIF